MLKLTSALNAWEKSSFEDIFKQAIMTMNVTQLPLQQGLAHSNYTDGSKRSVLILSATASADAIRVKTGIFYTGIITGCGCADDPTPLSEIAEYCEVQFTIDKTTAETTITLLQE